MVEGNNPSASRTVTSGVNQYDLLNEMCILGSSDRYWIIHLFSNLPIATHAFKHWHTDDAEIDVFVVKARFQRDAEDRFHSVPLEELALEDVFEGEPARFMLLCEQDIAPGKTATVLLVNAVVRRPSGSAMQGWAVAADVPDRLSYGFHVRGPCHWTRRAKAWCLIDPALVFEAPLTYGLAYGGSVVDEEQNEDVHELNPAGTGLVTPGLLKAREPIAAPQVGELAEFMVADVEAAMTVHGFGPIAKAWLPRRRQAGGFDDEWNKQRHPRMPRDYSLGFWNCAPLPLQISLGLSGRETIIFRGISSRRDSLVVNLPGVGMVVSVPREAVQALTLDTVSLYLSSDEPLDHAMELTWRGFQKSVSSEHSGEVQYYLIEE